MPQPTTPKITAEVRALIEFKRICRQPFSPEAVKWKVQTNPKKADGNAQIVAYIDARLAEERLNYASQQTGVVWSNEIRSGGTILQPGAAVISRLVLRSGAIEEIHEDVGVCPPGTPEMSIKGGPSDALKRAAVSLGVGAFLYALPKQWLGPREGLKITDRGGGKFQASLGWNASEPAFATLRKRYTEWLEGVGKATYGDAISHGELIESQGDPETNEVDAGPVEEEPAATPPAAAPQPAAAPPAAPAPEAAAVPPGSPATNEPDVPAAAPAPTEAAVATEQAEASRMANLQTLAEALQAANISGSALKNYLTAEFGCSKISDVTSEQIPTFAAWVTQIIQNPPANMLKAAPAPAPEAS